MATVKERIAAVRGVLTEEHKSDTIDKGLDWLTYVIGMLPDELMVGKVAQLANKLMADRALNSRFKDLQEQVTSTNERLSQLEGADKTEAIGATIATNTALQKTLSALLDAIKVAGETSGSEFVLDTRNWSTQELINTAIKADWVAISAANNSSNTVSGAHVTSNRTHLVSDGNSHNVVRDSTFTDGKGSVGMSGQHIQQGHVSVAGPSVGYHGNNSFTQMGGWRMGTDEKGNFVIGTVSDPTFTARCPKCHAEFNLRQSELLGRTHLTCPRCFGTSELPRR